MEKWIDKMTSRTYENIQGVLSYIVLFSVAIALTFTVDYYDLLAVSDLSVWGKTFMPPFIIGAWTIFGLAVVAKVWGAVVHFNFWYRIDISNKLHDLANRIDPRRR